MLRYLLGGGASPPKASLPNSKGELHFPLNYPDQNTLKIMEKMDQMNEKIDELYRLLNMIRFNQPISPPVRCKTPSIEDRNPFFEELKQKLLLRRISIDDSFIT
jgi:hypothetical protein